MLFCPPVPWNTLAIPRQPTRPEDGKLVSRVMAGFASAAFFRGVIAWVPLAFVFRAHGAPRRPAEEEGAPVCHAPPGRCGRHVRVADREVRHHSRPAGRPGYVQRGNPVTRSESSCFKPTPHASVCFEANPLPTVSSGADGWRQC